MNTLYVMKEYAGAYGRTSLSHQDATATLVVPTCWCRRCSSAAGQCTLLRALHHCDQLQYRVDVIVHKPRIPEGHDLPNTTLSTTDHDGRGHNHRRGNNRNFKEFVRTVAAQRRVGEEDLVQEHVRGQFLSKHQQFDTVLLRQTTIVLVARQAENFIGQTVSSDNCENAAQIVHDFSSWIIGN